MAFQAGVSARAACFGDAAMRRARLVARQAFVGALVASTLFSIGLPALAQQAAPVPIVDDALAASVRQLAEVGTDGAEAGAPRVKVEIGTLDPRLKLAPCARIEPRLPPGVRLLGRTRIALRCVDGPTKWQVWLPVTVQVWTRSVVASRELKSGDLLTAADVTVAEADIAAEPGAVVTDASRLVGRRLVRDARPGEALKDSHLKPRTWFAAGEPVRVVTNGDGWRIDVEAVALAPGLDGATVRARTESGRTVSGRAVAPHLIELSR